MHANELILYVADQARAKAFYADVLGLVPTPCSSGLVSRSNWATAARTVKISSREGVVVSSCSRSDRNCMPAPAWSRRVGGGRGWIGRADQASDQEDIAGPCVVQGPLELGACRRRRPCR